MRRADVILTCTPSSTAWKKIFFSRPAKFRRIRKKRRRRALSVSKAPPRRIQCASFAETQRNARNRKHSPGVNSFSPSISNFEFLRQFAGEFRTRGRAIRGKMSRFPNQEQSRVYAQEYSERYCVDGAFAGRARHHRVRQSHATIKDSEGWRRH